MNLSAWQATLQSHFEWLHQTRTSSAGVKPIFGLEHGLSESDVEALKSAIRTHIARSPPSNDHILPWVVYASEFGYLYTGHEYWQTFEAHTPGWEQHGDRNWIRECFLEFHIRYGGAKPSGPWTFFRNICWPITHAILPKDLQRQLAKILYDSRHSLSSTHFKAPLALGKLIAARGWDANSRFQQLAQMPELIGQIAAALLLPDDQRSDNLILLKTLDRIAADLDRERRARDWLKAARRAAQQSVQFPGIGSGSTGIVIAEQQSVDRARDQVTKLGIEPRLLLRPTASSAWDVLLEIPDFSHLLINFPRMGELLAGSRCTVAGASSRPLARGRLLHGPQRIVLREWPRPDKVLLQFEQSSQELDLLLSAECLLRAGPTWLFRIASDGLAYEVRSRVLRPNQKYVLLNTDGPVQLGPSMTSESVTCTGVHASRFDLEAAIPQNVMDHLEALGLNQAKRVEVWPAGLAAAGWVGDGRGEWLSSDVPCVGVRADYDVGSLLLTLNGDEINQLEIIPTEVGAAAFVVLPPLPAGTHRLRVSAGSTRPDAEEESGYLDVVIRDPRRWIPGVSSQGGLLVVVDPTTPTLEQLSEGRAVVEVHGPVTHQISCTANLFEGRASLPHLSMRLPPLQLPVDGAAWNTHFDRYCRQSRNFQNAYDLAHSCKIEFSAEELGKFTLSCEREFAPLRWAIRRTRQDYALRLLDDTGAEETTELFWYNFNAPEIATKLNRAIFEKFSSPDAPGLYVAMTSGCQSAVIIPPLVGSSSDLEVNPRITTTTCSTKRNIELISLFKVWSDARLTGDLKSWMMRRQVLLAISHHIFELICGSRWGKAERSLRDQGDDSALQNLAFEITNRMRECGLREALLTEYAELSRGPRQKRVSRLSTLARRHLGLEPPMPPIRNAPILLRKQDPCHPWWLSEFALRLASRPDTLVSWAGEHMTSGINRLLQVPTFARAARFFVLATDRYLRSNPVGAEQLYGGWDWQ